MQALEWYDLPETIKYLQYDTVVNGDREPANQLQLQFPKPVSPPKDLLHINNLALCEVQAALKDMEITNKVCAVKTAICYIVLIKTLAYVCVQL